MANDYKQKAGDNSTQIQASVVNVGIDEKRAREICYEIFAREASHLASEALSKANERVGILEGKLISKTEECQDLLEQFRKPEFLYLVQQAEKSAIQTDRESDYDMLVNLLLNKTRRENDRKFTTGVKQAIEIVNDIDDDSLKALSVLFVYASYSSNSSTCSGILDTMDSLFAKVGVNELPLDTSWMDQLDILKCIRLTDAGKYKKLVDYYFLLFDGLCVAGISKEDPHYAESLTLLKEKALPESILVDNELNPGFVRLNIGKKCDIDNLVCEVGEYKISLTDEQINALHTIYSFYSNDGTILQAVKERFNSEIEKRGNLFALKSWLENLPHVCDLTCVGKVLAYTKVKMMIHDLPNIFND